MEKHEDCIADGCMNKLGNHAQCQGVCHALQTPLDRSLAQADEAIVTAAPETDAVCARWFHDGGPAPMAPDSWVCPERAAGAIAEHARKLESQRNKLLANLQFAVTLLKSFPAVSASAQVQHMESVIARATGEAH